MWSINATSYTAWSCTTAVISGRVTADGRPILWKNRDYASARHNEVVVLSNGKYQGVAVVTAGSRTSVWMGANVAGLCIENSLSTDLGGITEKEDDAGDDGPGNGALMKLALESCATVEDFKHLLEQSNNTGRQTRGNFGVIDAQGGAAMFEVGPDSYTIFDANDPSIAPAGFIVRSNFATTAHDLPCNPTAEQLVEISSGDRYLRACKLLRQPAESQQNIDVGFVLQYMTRDLADQSGQPVPGSVNDRRGTLPPFVETSHTISRDTTVSSAVFHGVRAGEDPRLTTMWTMLGDPKFSIAVPCWPCLDAVADPLEGRDGGELGEIALLLRDWLVSSDPVGVTSSGLSGIWHDVLPIEQRFLQRVSAERDAQQSHLSPTRLANLHVDIAELALQTMHAEMLQAKAVTLVGSTLSVPLNVVTVPTEDTIRVAIYDHSDGSANGPKNLQRFLKNEHGFESVRVAPQDIRDQILGTFDVLIVPGGSGSSQAKHLEEEGKAAIKQFVEQGGGYVGICAGSYLASAHYSWSLGLINARVWDRAHWARGTGQVQLGITPIGIEALNSATGVVDVYYGQGPLLLPAEKSELPAYEVLATYRSEIAKKGAPRGAMLNTHAIIRAPFGEGRVICFSPHPEVQSGPNELMIEGVRWAAGSSKLLSRSGTD